MKQSISFLLRYSLQNIFPVSLSHDYLGFGFFCLYTRGGKCNTGHEGTTDHSCMITGSHVYHSTMLNTTIKEISNLKRNKTQDEAVVGNDGLQGGNTSHHTTPHTNPQ